MDLDPEGARRARVRAQLLDEPARSVAAVVTRLVGVQAQDERAAGLAIRARTTGLTAAAVIEAVARGTLVVTWTLRGTRHIHRRQDLPWLLALLAPMYAKPNKREADLGIAEAVGERAVAALREALSDGPLTRAQVKERLAPVGVNPTGQAAIHVIRRAALAGVLTVVPGEEGGKERYATVSLDPAELDRDEAVAELARRYVKGYGPATPADFATWSGLGLRVAESAWPKTRRTAPPTEPAPLRLLGGFDNLLLGYADRSAHVAPEHAGKVNAGGGLVKPVVIDDGRVVGTWTAKGDVHPFPGERFDAAAELADVQRFLTGRNG